MIGPQSVFPSGRLELYLTEISEPEDNILRIVVQEAGGRGDVEETELGAARRMTPHQGSRAFELVWSHYVAYAMRNESYVSLAPGETPYQNSLEELRSSQFMDYVRASTFADDDYPGPEPLTHWSLGTLNHILDVVSSVRPSIRALERRELERPPTNLNWAKDVSD